VRRLGEQQRIVVAERFRPGAIPDHRRFTPGHQRDLAGWQSRIPASRNAGILVLLKQFGG
jgi:hypothetical protein